MLDATSLEVQILGKSNIKLFLTFRTLNHKEIIASLLSLTQNIIVHYESF